MGKVKYEEGKKRKEKRKAIIIVSILVLSFVAAGIFAGLTLTNDAAAKDVPELKANEVEIVNDDGKVEVVEKDSKEAEEYEEAVKTGERDAVNTVKKAETTKSTSTAKKTTDKSSRSSATDKSKDKNTNSSTKKEESSNNKNDNKNDNKDSTASKHTHNWTAVYKEVDKGYYKTVTKREAYDRCTLCGADITGNTSAHLKQHALAGESASRDIGYRYYDVQEWVPNVEKVVDYYKCSCGATK